MNQSAHGKNRFHERLSRAQIHILGSLQLQNELFAGALADATGLKCSCSSNVSFPELNASDEEGDNMILWDCVDDDNQEILWEKIDPSFMLENVFFVLFNVTPDHKLENQAMKRGVKGLFYRDDSLAILKKGIHAVLGGELWFSRRSLSKYLAESRRMKMPVEEEKQILLTFREREILAMIADGLSKDDIAVDLGISPHTVKTHTHNIYQKINVPNRVKAAMWANRNLKFPRRTVRDSAARKSYHS